MIRVKVLKECSVLLLGSKKECRVQLIRVKVLKECSVKNVVFYCQVVKKSVEFS